MKKRFFILFLCLASIFLVACGKSKSTSSTQSRQLPQIEGFSYYGDIPQAPKRVASMSASYTGYLLQLGLTIVAATSYDKDNPILEKELIQAKQVMPTDLEALAATKPDLIIAGSTEENLEQLATIAPVIAVEYGKHDYLQVLTDFGKVFKKEKEAKNWLDAWQDKVQASKAKLEQALGSDKTFTVMGLTEKEIYLFGNNWGRGGEIIYQALGFQAPKKVQDEVFPKGYLSISKEVLPDYVGDYAIVATDKKTTTSSLYESDIWQSLPAVQNKRVLNVQAEAFYFNDPKALDYQLKILEDALLATTK
ncbi:iron-hydroxamate ABC transporter substrate-binding protein [Streptococcus cuniculipharyngis]|uniref:Iron-hydroxamate ABC transporter substrate-binding protein n=1 Tax=Streptococcus cuniculipharyngis TaxID=1562651 RepID=A0A5C5S8S4_9STRE|nr:iron-hydroxamate ABC transporter substrate-binding protein [Streptococcus cuniculipharyngis]TWS96657.1 iron-hydroxamate ABC transporter substrate-binding protein [Streptococcus cuniculipharyngis]